LHQLQALAALPDWRQQQRLVEFERVFEQLLAEFPGSRDG
jgi:hypothetical protein